MLFFTGESRPESESVESESLPGRFLGLLEDDADEDDDDPDADDEDEDDDDPDADEDDEDDDDEEEADNVL